MRITGTVFNADIRYSTKTLCGKRNLSQVNTPCWMQIMGKRAPFFIVLKVRKNLEKLMLYCQPTQQLNARN